MSKGSSRRPSKLSDAELAERWALAFGKEKQNDLSSGDTEGDILEQEEDRRNVQAHQVSVSGSSEVQRNGRKEVLAPCRAHS